MRNSSEKASISPSDTSSLQSVLIIGLRCLDKQNLLATFAKFECTYVHAWDVFFGSRWMFVGSLSLHILLCFVTAQTQGLCEAGWSLGMWLGSFEGKKWLEENWQVLLPKNIARVTRVHIELQLHTLCMYIVCVCTNCMYMYILCIMYNVKLFSQPLPLALGEVGWYRSRDMYAVKTQAQIRAWAL